MGRRRDRRQLALVAVEEVARREGLDASAAAVIAESNNTVVRLPAEDLVAKVSTSHLEGRGGAALERELRLGRQLADRGAPIAPPAPGPIAGPISDAIGRLRQAGGIAAEYGLRLAIEFNSQHPVLNTLASLRELLDGAKQKNCGYLIDTYHFARSGAGGRGFESVPAGQIFCFQYSDVSPQPVTGVARPTDRLPPGKGMVQWRDVLGLLSEKGYTGYLSYEAPNPTQWARSPYDVAREGVELTRMLLRDSVPSYAV